MNIFYFAFLLCLINEVQFLNIIFLSALLSAIVAAALTTVTVPLTSIYVSLQTH